MATVAAKTAYQRKVRLLQVGEGAQSDGFGVAAVGGGLS